MPAGYRRCEYLEIPVGWSGPWIDTMIPAANNLLIDIDFQTLNTYENGDSECWVFGYWRAGVCTLIGRYTKYAQARQGTDTVSNGVYFPCDYQRHRMGWDADYYYLDGERYDSAIAPQFNTYTTTQTFPLFRSSHSGSRGARIWKFVARDLDKKPVSTMIPALDPAGKPCMYDTVRAKPFYNVGSGQFLYKLA